MQPLQAPSRVRKKLSEVPSVWAHLRASNENSSPLTYVNGPDHPSAILMQGCKQ